MRPPTAAWLAGIALALVACRQTQSPAPSTSVAPAPAAVASPSPAAPSGVSVVSASPVASPAARASSSPPRARVPLRLAVTLNPTTPSVGQTFTLSLAITNDGTRPAEGVYVSTSGPWDRYTVLSVRPVGTFVRDATGWHIGSPLRVGAGETQSLVVEARADEPSDEQLTFAVREAEPGEVP